MDTYTFAKDIAQFITVRVAIIGGLIAAFRAIVEMQQNRQQRVKELRWRQANLAKDVLDEMFSHPYSENAVFMLDWDQGKRMYEVKKDTFESISYHDVISAI